MINPDMRCDFEVHLSDMLNISPSKGEFDVIREMRAIDAKITSIFFGSDERVEVLQSFQQTGAKVKLYQATTILTTITLFLDELLVKEMMKK